MEKVVVNPKYCKACGLCLLACKKNVLAYGATVNAMGYFAVVPKNEAACIGCKMCEKACQFDAVKVLDNVAHIDPEKCTGCGACAAKCPKKVIL